MQIRERLRRSGRGGTGPEATFDGSRGLPARIAALGATLRASGGVAIGVAAAGALSALLLAVTEFLTVASVDVARGSCQVLNDANPSIADRCSLSGFERHGGAFVRRSGWGRCLTIGASAGCPRPAAVALVVIGAVV